MFTADKEIIQHITDRFWELNPDKDRYVDCYIKWGHDREHILAYQREWRNKNHKAFLAISRRANNKPKSRAKASIRKHTYRALLAGCEGSHTVKEWELKKELYNHRCCYCNVKLNGKHNKSPNQLTKDHIIPLSEGGSNDIGNIVPACRKCNMLKWKNLKWLNTREPRIPFGEYVSLS